MKRVVLLPLLVVGAARPAAADEAAPAHLYFYDTKTRKTVGEIDAMSDKGRAVFGPGSDLVAVDVFNGAAIYDVARRKYVAEEMGDRSASHPTLFAPSGDRKGDDDKHMPYYVWSLLPSGTDLLQAAAGQLSKAQAGRVVAERIGLWQIN